MAQMTLDEWFSVSWPRGVGDRERVLVRVSSTMRSYGWKVSPIATRSGEPSIRAVKVLEDGREHSVRVSVTPLDELIIVYRDGHVVPHVYDTIPDFIQRLESDFETLPAPSSPTVSSQGPGFEFGKEE